MRTDIRMDVAKVPARPDARAALEPPDLASTMVPAAVMVAVAPALDEHDTPVAPRLVSVLVALVVDGPLLLPQDPAYIVYDVPATVPEHLSVLHPLVHEDQR